MIAFGGGKGERHTCAQVRSRKIYTFSLRGSVEKKKMGTTPHGFWGVLNTRYLGMVTNHNEAVFPAFGQLGYNRQL